MDAQARFFPTELFPLNRSLMPREGVFEMPNLRCRVQLEPIDQLDVLLPHYHFRILEILK